MSLTSKQVLEHNVLDLTEQLYASYARNKELVVENNDLKEQIESQQSVIDGLAGELSGQCRAARPE